MHDVGHHRDDATLDQAPTCVGVHLRAYMDFHRVPGEAQGATLWSGLANPEVSRGARLDVEPAEARVAWQDQPTMKAMLSQ